MLLDDVGFARTSLGTVDLDLSGLHPLLLGGSLFMLMCVDSISRFMMPHGPVRKSDALVI